MPEVQVNGTTLHYLLEGPAGAPVVCFGHGQALDLSTWDAQVPALTDRYRMLRLDLRGHGGSPVPDDPFSIEDLASDIVGLLDTLDIEKNHYVGTSLGGFIGFALALEHQDRLASLTLVATQGALPQERAERVREAAGVTRTAGMADYAEAMMHRWLRDGFEEQEPDAFARLCHMVAASSGEGYAKSSDTSVAMNFDDRLADITTPTLVVAGDEDVATPPERMALYRDEIAGAEMVVIEESGHFPNLEQPAAFNAALRRFLDAIEDRSR